MAITDKTFPADSSRKDRRTSVRGLDSLNKLVTTSGPAMQPMSESSHDDSAIGSVNVANAQNFEGNRDSTIGDHGKSFSLAAEATSSNGKKLDVIGTCTVIESSKPTNQESQIPAMSTSAATDSVGSTTNRFFDEEETVLPLVQSFRDYMHYAPDVEASYVKDILHAPKRLLGGIISVPMEMMGKATSTVMGVFA